MSTPVFDCIVLGAGPGGYVAAIRAAQLGLKTAIIEKENPGGVCLNWGCIPTKALLKSAEVFQTMKHADQLGLKTEGLGYDFDAIISRSRSVVDKMTGGVKFLLKKNKVELFMGNGRIKAGNFVTVTGDDGKETTLEYKNLIISTGGRARTLPSLPLDGERIFTYREALELRERPGKMLVVGAGAIGMEFAYFYNSFGTDVTVVELQDSVLPIEDQEISKGLQKSFSKQGIELKTGAMVESLQRTGETIKALIKRGDKAEEWTGDYVLVAIGIQGNVENIGLEEVGLRAERSFIEVDKFYRTGVQGIYAIGDVTGPPLLAHVASHEGVIAAEHIAGASPHAMDYSSVPACTYCQPQVASIGMTEKAARDEGYEIKVGKFPFTASGKAVAINETEGMVKVVTDSDTGEILGVHILHAEATELIGEAAIIRTHEGVAKSVFNTVHAHPTLSEAVMEAMGDALGHPIHI